MIIEYIEQLRKQPAEIRRRYALFFTSVVTVVIVLIYVTSLFINSLGTRSVDDRKTATEKSEEQSISNMFNSSNVFVNEGEVVNKKEQSTWKDEFMQLYEE